MTTSAREVAKGLLSGAGFLLAAFPLGMPLALAAGAAVGLYFGLTLILRRPPGVLAEAALGLSAGERDSFLSACRQSHSDLMQLAAQIPNRAFAERVAGLARVSANLAAYFERKPDAILLASSVPQNLARLAGMLRQYVAISGYHQAGETAEEALRRVEGVFDAASRSFAGMYQQLLNNDVAALETSAHTLAILMEVEPRTINQRLGEQPPHQPGQPAFPPSRRAQKETPL